MRCKQKQMTEGNNVAGIWMYTFNTEGQIEDIKFLRQPSRDEMARKVKPLLHFGMNYYLLFVERLYCTDQMSTLSFFKLLQYHGLDHEHSVLTSRIDMVSCPAS